MLFRVGLLCGIIEGLQKVGWGDIPIIACETQGAHSFNESGIATLAILPLFTCSFP